MIKLKPLTPAQRDAASPASRMLMDSIAAIQLPHPHDEVRLPALLAERATEPPVEDAATLRRGRRHAVSTLLELRVGLGGESLPRHLVEDLSQGDPRARRAVRRDGQIVAGVSHVALRDALGALDARAADERARATPVFVRGVDGVPAGRDADHRLYALARPGYVPHGLSEPVDAIDFLDGLPGARAFVRPLVLTPEVRAWLSDAARAGEAVRLPLVNGDQRVGDVAVDAASLDTLAREGRRFEPAKVRIDDRSLDQPAPPPEAESIRIWVRAGELRAGATGPVADVIRLAGGAVAQPVYGVEADRFGRRQVVPTGEVAQGNAGVSLLLNQFGSSSQDYRRLVFDAPELHRAVSSDRTGRLEAALTDALMASARRDAQRLTRPRAAVQANDVSR